ncbi:MAG: 50S ribosomal protein L11 methyltransferase [Solirubrobacteraceae bacterium]
MVRLAVRVRRHEAEIVLAELLSLAPGGVEEVDVGPEVVEYVVYGAPGELPALPDLKAVAGGALVEVLTSEVPDDWDQRWRSFHKPLVLDGGRLVVRPPWEPLPAGADIDLVIDPGQAFGTGAHATTRLCLELMLGLAAPGSGSSLGSGSGLGEFLDLGCGSGVLAIAAARLGWAPVAAVDFDPLAVAAASSNASVNGVSVEVGRHDLRVDPVLVAPFVAANLLRPLLLTWASRLDGASALPGRVIASGLLVGEADEIARAFASVGLREADRRTSGDWAALLLARQR